MTERVWQKRPPPHVGWWNASTRRSLECWRWWNGSLWSCPLNESTSLKDVTVMSRIPTLFEGTILWTDYWPENARVPRLDPTGGHWTFNVDGTKPEWGPYFMRIELAFRAGLIGHTTNLASLDWTISGHGGDILAWRPAA